MDGREATGEQGTSGNTATMGPEVGAEEKKAQLRRVVIGAVVGTALEWYDFFIYGTAGALRHLPRSA